MGYDEKQRLRGVGYEAGDENPDDAAVDNAVTGVART